MAKKPSPFYDSEKDRAEITKNRLKTIKNKRTIKSLIPKKEKPYKKGDNEQNNSENKRELTDEQKRVKKNLLSAKKGLTSRGISPSDFVKLTVHKEHKKYDEEKKKQIRRLRRFIKSAQERGFEFDDNIIDLSLSAEELKKIKPKDLYKYSSYFDEISQQTFTGEEGRRIENFRRSQKAKDTKAKNDLLVLELADDNTILDDNITEEIDEDMITTEFHMQELYEEREQRKSEYKPDSNLKDNSQFNQQTNEDFINYTNLTEVDDIIDFIPDYRFIAKGEKMDLRYYKYGVKNIWENTKAHYTTNQNTGEVNSKGLATLSQYINENMHRIESLFDTINRSSDREEIEGCFNELIQILNNNTPLTHEQSDFVEQFNEAYFDGY